MGATTVEDRKPNSAILTPLQSAAHAAIFPCPTVVVCDACDLSDSCMELLLAALTVLDASVVQKSFAAPAWFCSGCSRPQKGTGTLYIAQ